MSAILEEILDAFGGSQVNVKDLPDDDPRALLGRQCEGLFTSGVRMFRSVLPNDRLRALARVIWDLVEHKQVVVAIGPDVPSLSFTVMQLKIVRQGLVLIPKNWPEQIRADYFMQLGAILYVGAQVVDFYNDRLIDDPTAPARWSAYEAEYLRMIKDLFPRGWTPNDYQRGVMEKYPDGLDSPGVELYAFKSYEPPREQA
jgi:hypothetical protein